MAEIEGVGDVDFWVDGVTAGASLDGDLVFAFVVDGSPVWFGIPRQQAISLPDRIRQALNAVRALAH